MREQVIGFIDKNIYYFDLSGITLATGDKLSKVDILSYELLIMI